VSARQQGLARGVRTVIVGLKLHSFEFKTIS
jgi:hypothetical protein